MHADHGGAFGATVTSPVIDYGYDTGRGWPDFNGDGKADYYQRVGGSNNQDSHIQCTLSVGNALGATGTSPVLDYGYDTGRSWVGAAFPAPAGNPPPSGNPPGQTSTGRTPSSTTLCIVPALRHRTLARAKRALHVRIAAPARFTAPGTLAEGTAYG